MPESPTSENKIDNGNETSNILKGNVEFKWHHPPLDNWGGIPKDELQSLTGNIGLLLGIKPSEADSISLIIGDNLVPVFDGIRQEPTTGRCFPVYGKDEVASKAVIILNRSKEVRENSFMSDRGTGNKDKIARTGAGKVADEDTLEYVNLETPGEIIIALLAEELDHARVLLRTKTLAKHFISQLKFEKTLSSREQPVSDIYETSLLETTAKRQVLRVLATLASPERRPVFRELFRETLQSGKMVIPGVSTEVVDSTFIPTGEFVELQYIS